MGRQGCVHQLGTLLHSRPQAGSLGSQDAGAQGADQSVLSTYSSWHWAQSSVCANSAKSPRNPMRWGPFIAPFLEGGNRPREAKLVAQGHATEAGFEPRLQNLSLREQPVDNPPIVRKGMGNKKVRIRRHGFPFQPHVLAQTLCFHL